MEVAVGLETVQPRWLQRLGKRMSRDNFDAYARWLRAIDVDLRVFLIVGVPGISIGESIRWARLSVRHASKMGARHVSLIPARVGHGWNGMSEALPDVSLSHLGELLTDTFGDSESGCFVNVDLWDYERATNVDLELLQRIRRMNETQVGASGQ